MGLAFVGFLQVARMLEPSEIGQFTFFRSVVNLVGLPCELGFSLACGRLLAGISDDHGQRQLCGAWLAITVPVGLTFASMLALASGWIDAAFKMNVREVLLVCALPVFGVPMELGLRELLQGRGMIRLLVLLNLAPWVLFIVGLGLLQLARNASFSSVALLYSGSYFLSSICVTLLLRPRFSNLKRTLAALLAETKKFGAYASFSRIVGTGAVQLDSPIIAHFTGDAHALGLYGLARGMVLPIAMASRSLAVSMYRSFVSIDKIPKRLVYLDFTLLAGLCIGFAVAGVPILLRLLGAKYFGLSLFLYLWLPVSFIQGLNQLPNYFLFAKGQGRVIARIAAWFSFGQIVLLLVLVPRLGAIGAVFATGGGYALFTAMSIYHYRLVVAGREAVVASQPASGA